MHAEPLFCRRMGSRVREPFFPVVVAVPVVVFGPKTRVARNQSHLTSHRIICRTPENMFAEVLKGARVHDDSGWPAAVTSSEAVERGAEPDEIPYRCRLAFQIMGLLVAA